MAGLAMGDIQSVLNLFGVPTINDQISSVLVCSGRSRHHAHLRQLPLHR
ncbi:hypothetical protein [Moraxella lacunata]